MVTPETEAGPGGSSGSKNPIKENSAADRIAIELRTRILNGDFPTGQRLPPERELTSLFGASRGTVREALRSLEVRDMVSRRVGSGTYVTYQPGGHPDDVAETTSPLELVDVRSAVEPHIVRLAVRNARARDIAALDEAMEGMAGAVQDPERFTQLDELFHLRLAEATRNPLFVDIYKQINHVRGHAAWSSIKDTVLSADGIRNYNHEHKALRDAVAQRDATRAVEIIERHLEHARRDLMLGTA